MVNLRNANIVEVFSRCKDKRVYAFGKSDNLQKRLLLRTPDYDILDLIYKFIDNDVKKQREPFFYKEKSIETISVEIYASEVKKNDIVIITSVRYGEIIDQLDEIKEFDGLECYILSFIDDIFDSQFNAEIFNSYKADDCLIPPVIHYCWFGDRKIPAEYINYIESWRKNNPGYEIKLWNEENYDIEKHPYMKWAYNNRMWAFVSDYARLDIIFQNGGIYLDTDVEVLQSLDDLRKFHAFIGYESTMMLNSGLGVGCEKENKAIGDMLKDYDNCIIDGVFNNLPCTVYQTNNLRKKGLNSNNSLQLIQDGNIVVLPTEVLCGIRLCTRVQQITKNTLSIHHYSGDWGIGEMKEKYESLKKHREQYASKLWKRINEI